MLFQRCLRLINMTLRRQATQNQRWNNVEYTNVGTCNVKQRRSNVFIFDVDLRNVGQRRSNVVTVIICKKKK